VILKPSLVYGNGAKSMGLFRAMAALPIIPLIEGGTQKMQPIYVDDLVDTIISCLGKETPAQLNLDVVGPVEMSMEELLLKQRRWLGYKSTKTISTPLKWVLRLMPFTRWLDEPALTADSLKMLQRDNIAELSPLKKALGKTPVSMGSVLTNQQASNADRWYAGLYFMRPLLRLGIAFIWIWTAIISAFFYPQTESYQLLEHFGLSGVMLPIALYGSALLDFILGVAMFLYQPLRTVLWLQAGVIIGYTLLISFVLPEYWLHPFGEMSKNIPLLLSLFILMIMEARK
jgi:small-conductance mechanosensitive channel